MSSQRIAAHARGLLVVALFLPAALAAQSEMPATIKQQGCLSCHDMSNYKVGPPFKTVAAKYRANREAGEKRITAILKDGVGHPKSTLSPEQIKEIADWVLGL